MDAGQNTLPRWLGRVPPRARTSRARLARVDRGAATSSDERKLPIRGERQEPDRELARALDRGRWDEGREGALEPSAECTHNDVGPGPCGRLDACMPVEAFGAGVSHEAEAV